MATTSKTYTGTSAGPDATIDDALDNALEGARRAENTNHVSWTLVKVHGDYGGVAVKTIKIEIAVQR